MPAEPQNPAQVDCRTPQGRILARLYLWPPRRSAEGKARHAAVYRDGWPGGHPDGGPLPAACQVSDR
jgi:hypothetical protein